MGKIPVEQVTDGMIAAEEVRDAFGRVLMNAGRELTKRQADILRSYGIREVDIQGADELSPAAAVHGLHPEQVSEAEKECEELYKYCDRSWDVIEHLFHASVLVTVRGKENLG